MATLDSNDFKSEKLPTLHQYRKAGKLKAKNYTVMKVWFPGAIPVLTLETDCFRLNVKQNTNAFESITEDIARCVREERSYFVQVQDVEDLTLETLLLDGEECDWRELGGYGYASENHRKAVAKKTPPKGKTTQNS